MNNIEGAKLVSAAQNGIPVEGGVQNPTANGDGFADALTGQLELLNEPKVQAATFDPAQNLTEHQTSNNLFVTSLLPGNLGGEPLGSASPPIKVNKDNDLSAALDTVTDILKYTARGAGEEPALVNAGAGKLSDQKSESKTEDLSLILAGTEGHSSSQAQIGQEKIVDIPVYSGQEKIVDMPVYSGQEKIADNPVQETENADIEFKLISDTPSPVSLAVAGETGEASSAAPKKLKQPASENNAENGSQNPILAEALPLVQVYSGRQESSSDLVHETEDKSLPQSFKPVFEEFKPELKRAKGESEDVRQTGAAFGQLVKEAQNHNPSPTEKTGPTERSAPVEAKPSISDAGGGLTHGVAESAQPNRQPLENRIDVPAMTKFLGHPEWNKELGERILWMNNRDASAAEIKLNPQHLGPISVRIDMNNDQATVSITTQHASVRDALEASIPKLREMMSSQQLNLAEINVSHNAFSDQRQSQPQRFSQNAEGLGQDISEAAETTDEAESGAVAASKGILSIYA